MIDDRLDGRELVADDEGHRVEQHAKMLLGLHAEALDLARVDFPVGDLAAHFVHEPPGIVGAGRSLARRRDSSIHS